jgi:hypothetical protein
VVDEAGRAIQTIFAMTASIPEGCPGGRYEGVKGWRRAVGGFQRSGLGNLGEVSGVDVISGRAAED